MALKWVSNTINPANPDADSYVAARFDQSQADAIREYKCWLNGKVIGLPHATERFTVEELLKMDVVGVYLRE